MTRDAWLVTLGVAAGLWATARSIEQLPVTLVMVGSKLVVEGPLVAWVTRPCSLA